MNMKKRLLTWILGMMGMGCIVGAAEAVEVSDARLQAVLHKLDSGQPITVAAIGGSITTGYATNPPREHGWAAQVGRWLGQRGQVRFINAGVSGTDSAAAVQRVKAHVLDANPDLVFVEYGVNDQWLDERVRQSSYEGLLRQLLSASHSPAVLPLLLTQQGNQPRDAVELQQRLATHYGLSTIDFGKWMAQRVKAGSARWETLYDEPVHPNQRGHDAIAQAVIETLQAAAKAPAERSAAKVELPAALYGRDHEFVRNITGDEFKPWRQHGFVRGGEMHPEWASMPGGQQPGWTATSDDAQASFLVWGAEIALFHAESEHYRNLEAWVDDGDPVTVRGQVPERKGYLGWHYSVIGRDLEPGAHLLHVRVKRDEWSGSGRAASFLTVMAAGLRPPDLQAQLPGDFEPVSALAKGWKLVRPDDAHLAYVGRFDRRDPTAPLLSWSGSEIRARFTGTRLALRLAPTQNISHYTVQIDGRRHVLALRGAGPHDWRLRAPLPSGTHELRIVKRTEGAMAEARFMGLLLDADGQLLAPPPPRPLRLEFYGDSITAGACNGDMGADQYDDLSTHDGTRAYGAVVAERLGADYVGIAVSGIGITRTWDTMLMPQIWDRVAPHLDAPVAPLGTHSPDVVVVNLGQNDHGFPASRGEPFAADFAQRYLAFVRQLRQRYPQAKLVLTLGGMPAWKEQPALLPALNAAAQRLRAEGDQRVWTYTFQVYSFAHPRIDVHAQMADELLNFLQTKVLP
jgi:lysophospholipase L1-like esterase